MRGDPIRRHSNFPGNLSANRNQNGAAYLCLHAPENNPGRNNMTTMINEAGAPAGVINRNSGGRLAFDGNRPAINADALGADPRGAADLPLDQTFPRLLYELGGSTSCPQRNPGGVRLAL